MQHQIHLSDSERRARYLSHLEDCIALADGTTTITAIEAKWSAVYAQDRLDASRQGVMPV